MTKCDPGHFPTAFSLKKVFTFGRWTLNVQFLWTRGSETVRNPFLKINFLT